MQAHEGDYLERVLQQTYAALRAGRLQDLAALTQATEAGLAAIAGLSDPVLAAKLHHLAERNARCLLASAKGVRAARRRLVEVTQANAGLQTYDGRGKPRKIDAVSGALKARF